MTLRTKNWREAFSNRDMMREKERKREREKERKREREKERKREREKERKREREKERQVQHQVTLDVVTGSKKTSCCSYAEEISRLKTIWPTDIFPTDIWTMNMNVWLIVSLQTIGTCFENATF
jgi:primosomal protein N'